MLETQRILVENILAFNEQQNREKIEMMQLESKVRLHRWLLVAMIVALASLLLTALVMISRLKLKAEHIKLKNEQLQIAQDLAIEKAQSQDAKEHYVEVLGALSRTNVAHNITVENIKQNGEEWLQHQFSIAYPKFWQNIQERGLSLGKREKLFLILLVIGLETHNIAEILGIEKRSVNINRYRLRQKFALKSDESLEDYLHALVNQSENKNF